MSSLIENIEKDLELSKTFLTRISDCRPKVIKAFFESIYEMYKQNFSDELLTKDYEENRIFEIRYNKDGYVGSASLRWNYYDSGEIRLKYSGMEIVFKPEHGCEK